MTSKTSKKKCWLFHKWTYIGLVYKKVKKPFYIKSRVFGDYFLVKESLAYMERECIVCHKKKREFCGYDGSLLI